MAFTRPPGHSGTGGAEVEKLGPLSEASVAILAAEGVEDILDAATGHAMRVLGARRARGCLGVPARPNETLSVLARDVADLSGVVDVLPRLDPLHRPARLARGEVDGSPRFQHLPEADRLALRDGWIAVPLVDLVGGRSGAIQLFERVPGSFTEADEAILSQLAQIASLALQKARLIENLQESEERYRRLFHAHLSGDFVMGVDGLLEEVNPAFARMLGYGSAEELCGVDVSTLYRHPRERQWLVQQIRRRRRAVQYETEFQRADGLVVHAIMNVVGIFDRSGELTGLQGCVFDSTDRKRVEAALQESQEQLLQAQKMEAVGQLAGGIAHDFNNMLMAIQGFVELMEQEIAPTGPVAGHLAQIRKAADRSARLTRQLLAYSRKQVLQPEVIEMNAVVAGMEDMLRRLIGAHVTFGTALNPAAGRVNADPGQLQQVLMNLVLNARDAMPAGGRLVVGTGSLEVAEPLPMNGETLPAGRYSTLSVSDEGEGIPPEVLPRVFEPFFTTKRVGEGSGLGLSTVIGIVKQSGGYVKVETAVGEGTTFTILLPMTETASTPETLPPSAADRYPCRGGVVLVAEDEAVLRSLVAVVLRRSGYEVLEAEDGEHAMEIAAGRNYLIDVLVTDLIMPRLGGQPLARRLREECPDLAVVFMSGFAEEAIQRYGVLAEGSKFLEKPFSPSLLVTAVRELLTAEAGGGGVGELAGARAPSADRG